jgi:FAD/FMN-containing dehydrogenase
VLEDAIEGAVVVPGSPRYDELRTPAMARFRDVRPEAIVLCQSAADVAETIAFATGSGRPLAVRSGGHCVAGRSSSEGVVLDVTPMGSVSFEDGVAILGAGARLGEVYDALDPYGVTIPAGCGPGVGIAGLTLGGGLGILGRHHGLTCDRLRAAQVVLADGRVVDCDEDRDQDLFWALRGAGLGTFGVVTSLTFETVPAPATTIFELSWPFGEAARVVEAWQSWAPDGPEELAASLMITAAGDEPTVSVFGALSGGERGAKTLLDGFVAEVRTEPEEDWYDHLPYHDAKRRLAERGPDDDEGRVYCKSEFFRDRLPPDAVDALVRALDDERGPLESRGLDFMPWGGAYNRPAPDATAFPHRDERFLLKQAVSLAPDASEAERDAGVDWLQRSWTATHAFGSGGAYPNFPDPELDDEAGAYWGANVKRLLAVKAAYDPEDRFGPLLSASARTSR